MLCFSALVAGSFSLGSQVGPYIEPAVLNAMRFLLAALLLFGAAFATGGVKLAAFAAPWRYFVLSGLFAFYFVMMFIGLKTAEPVSMAAVFTLNPALAAIFGFIVMRQVTTPRMALAIVVGGLGAVWVIFRADLSALLAFEVGKGEMIYFWGCITHALYPSLLRRLSRGEPALVFNAGVVGAGAVILCIWAAPQILATDWRAMPPVVWVTLIYLTIFSTALTFVLLRIGSLRLPSAKVMAYTYAVPTWVILWEMAQGRGVTSALMLPGILLTALSLLLLLKDESSESPSPAKT